MIKRSLIQKELKASGIVSSSSNSGAIVIPEMDYGDVLLELSCTQASGTSPTLDVYFQESLDGGATFVDVVHFTQVTASAASSAFTRLSVRELKRSDDAVVGTVGDATTSAGQLSGLPLVSNVWRVKWVLGGTSPAFTFGVTAHY